MWLEPTGRDLTGYTPLDGEGEVQRGYRQKMMISCGGLLYFGVGQTSQIVRQADVIMYLMSAKERC